MKLLLQSCWTAIVAAPVTRRRSQEGLCDWTTWRIGRWSWRGERAEEMDDYPSCRVRVGDGIRVYSELATKKCDGSRYQWLRRAQWSILPSVRVQSNEVGGDGVSRATRDQTVIDDTVCEESSRASSSRQVWNKVDRSAVHVDHAEMTSMATRRR